MSTEPKIARTVAEAQVGDLLWVCEDRRSSSHWQLWPVRKVGKIYAYVGYSDGDWSWVRIPREHPYDKNRMIVGWRERAVRHLRSLEARMIARIKTADLETLKTVAFALGLDDQPDFSVVPRPTTPPGPDTREGE